MTVETLHLHKSRVGTGGLPHDHPDLRRPRAGVAMHRRRLRSGWEHLCDMAKGVGVEGFEMATTLSSNYDELRMLLATTTARKAKMEKLCIDEML
ncbi:hypothetical protein HN51_058813 [Arachis hypogaea]